jgi:DNA repair photolyase
VREIAVERALMPEGPGHYYFNPYVGCMIGCAFCYVQERADFSRRLEALPRLEWGRYVDVKVNAAEVLRREVKQHPPGIVRMSPILTDPYQPIERRYRITRQALEVFLDAGFAPVILTRGARVVEDLELLRRFPAAAVGFSIPTDDDSVRVAFEPGADPVEERLEALAACHAAGLRTFAVIQPVLPMNVDRLVQRLAPIVRAVRVDCMQDVARHRHLYEAAGMLHALEPAFFEATSAALREGFARHRVTMDEMDDLGALMGRA